MDILTRNNEIDAYLLGTMSAERRAEFEVQLRSDGELRRDVALQREIIRAIREREVRNMMSGFDRRKKVMTALRRAVAGLLATAVAACVIGVAVVMPQMRRLETLSQSPWLYVQTSKEIRAAYSTLKGCDEAASYILRADSLILSGQYAEADASLDEALVEMGNVNASQPQAWAAKEDMLYMQAVCAIRQHKLLRVKRLLGEVIDMKGTHESEAKKLLHTIKHGEQHHGK